MQTPGHIVIRFVPRFGCKNNSWLNNLYKTRTSRGAGHGTRELCLVQGLPHTIARDHRASLSYFSRAYRSRRLCEGGKT